ncbi:MAG: hypothetical protein ACE5K7_00995 [Phycisphaerae bacterium]
MSLTSNQRRQMGMRYFAMPPRFDPAEGTTVFEPPGQGYGYWVGGHNAVFDPESGKFYLFCRLRRPLGKGRGELCRIAESADGMHFKCIWEASKQQFDAESIEVGSLIRDARTGRWRLYVSFQRAGQGWRVDLVEAEELAGLDAWHHRTVMQAGDYGLSSIKDPKIYMIGGLYHAFVCVPARRRFAELADGSRRAVGADATALLTSEDGIYWRELRYVLEPGRGPAGEWGHFRARINSVVWLEPMWVGFFDGGEGSYDNYEEWCGVAISSDLLNWRRVSRTGPWVRSPYGCVRYMDVLRVEDTIYYYYEYARRDGSHELRVSRVEL